MGNSKEDANIFSVILSGLAGLGAIIATLSPIIFNNTFIGQLFLDQNLVAYASILSLLVIIATVWLSSSFLSYDLFGGNQSSRTIFRGIVGFTFLGIFFYALKLIGISNASYSGFCAVLQFFSYVGSFLCLGLILGLLFRDTMNGYRYKNNEDKKYDLIKQAIINSGLIQIDIKILSIMKKPEDLYYTLIIMVGNDKYQGFISQDYITIANIFKIDES